jgi:hypothetical protein
MKTRRMTVVAMMLMIVFFAVAGQRTAIALPAVTSDTTGALIPTTTQPEPAAKEAESTPANVQPPAKTPTPKPEEERSRVKPPDTPKREEVQLKTPGTAVEEPVKPTPDPDRERVMTAALTAAARAEEAKAAAERASTASIATKSVATLSLIAAVAGVFFSSTALFFLVLPFLRKPSPQPPKENELALRLTEVTRKLENGLQSLADRVQKSGAAIEERLAPANVARPEHLTPINKEVRGLREDVAHLRQQLAQFPRAAAEQPATDPVALERQVLAEWWKLFRANGELSAAFDAASQDSAWDPLLRDLTKTVPQDLKPTFDAVVAPWREHRHLIQKIAYVPRLVGGDVERLPDAEELRRMREFADLLRSAQSSADAPNRLTFRFKSWVTDAFLPFADLFLQRYQQARLDNRHRELEAGVALVIDLLRVAAVEPIDVTPGETPFDSTRHIGRSTSNDQRFADGVITGVVRNGFIEGGQQVIRQPEVIVNRLR